MAFEEVSHVQHALQELQGHNVLDGLEMAVVRVTRSGNISLPGIKTTSKIIVTLSYVQGTSLWQNERDAGTAGGRWVTVVADDTISCDPSCLFFTLVIFYYNPVVPD